MEPRKIFSLLREHTLTALIIVGLFALAPMSIPALRSELISAIHPNATIAHIDGEPDDLAEDASEPVDPASPPAPGDKPGLFKRLITSPARLMTKLFRGKDRNQKDQSARLSRPTAKDIEKFRSVPVSRTRDGMGSEVAREELYTSSASAAATPATPAPLAESIAATVERTAANLFDQATELQEKGLIDNAIERLGQALTLKPNLAEGHNLMGVCFDQKTMFVAAQSEYHQAIKIESGNPRFLNNLGYSYYLAGDNANAVKWYKKALKYTPDDKRLHNNIGLAYGRKGESKKALEHFTRSVGEAGSHLNLGYVLNQQGRSEDAIKEYETALRLQPQSLTALSSLVPLYERTGRLREAAYASEMQKKISISQREQTAQKP